MPFRHDDPFAGATASTNSGKKAPPQVLVVDETDEIRFCLAFFLRTGGGPTENHPAMSGSTPPRPLAFRRGAALFIAAQTLGWLTPAQTADPAPYPAPMQAPSIPAVRRSLREFDRFLDHHPLLEEQLRLDPQLTTDPAFGERNPELRDFLRANPPVAEGLKIYPRYFLYRALLREANAPLSFPDLAPFKDLFQQQPGLERKLTESPEVIRDPGFCEAHAALRDFLHGHPALARVFARPSVQPVSH